MQYLPDTNILCLEYDELVPDVMPKGTYDSLKDRDNIKVHGRGGNGRDVLIEYEALPPRYKEKVDQLYGNVYAYASKQPILKAVQRDHQAYDYYSNYILPNGSMLPADSVSPEGKPQINYVDRYTTAASWLNMLIRMTTDKMALKRELNIPIMAFWDQATDLVKIKKVNLPGNAKRLKEKIRMYQKRGYETLIETHKFGNINSAKIRDEEAETVLKGLLSLRNKHDFVEVAKAYNAWAAENNREGITPEAVRYRFKQWENELMLLREGTGKAYTTLSKQIKQKRPSAPLLRVDSDDNILDVFFRAPGNDWYRPALYVVLDAHNDYILGYAIGDRVTKELIYEAYRNAQRHVAELTGGAYLWQQIKTDHWGISGKNTTDLEAFYNSMATFTPAGLKNKQSKYIERAFGTDWHKMLKKLFRDSYSGHNVTAKEKLNPDTLKPANFPPIEHCYRMVSLFMEAMRLTTRKGKQLNRQQEWLEAFRASATSKEVRLSNEQRLSIFGIHHEHLNTITAAGVTPTLMGQKIAYELSQAQIFEHAGKQVQVVYDPYDLSEVLVTDGKGLRFVAHEFEKMPSAIADYKPGDRERLNRLLEEKKTLNIMLAQHVQLNSDALKDAESRLQAGVLVKEVAHQDQHMLTARQNGAQVKADDDQDREINIYDEIYK